MHSRSTALAGLLGLALLLGGCGGGGCGCSSDGSNERLLPGEASLDGWVQSDGFAKSDGGGPIVGDVDSRRPGVGHRQFFSFRLDALPPGAAIQKATLALHQEITAGSPFATMGVVVVDHVDYGTTLDGADYAAPALTANLGTLTSDAGSVVRTLDVTAAVQADLAAARPRSQFRLLFSVQDSDGDVADDFVTLADTESSLTGVAVPPHLEIVLLP